MARTKITDVDDPETLDGADVIDRAPEPDDDEQRTRDRAHSRTRLHRCAVPQVRGVQRGRS